MGVTPNMKIAEVLKKYPELLEVLVGQSPHFARLRNPILRRVQGRLVTVAQAAAIGGVDPRSLVRTLNAALGEHDDGELAPIELDSTVATPPPPWLATAEIAASLDVRASQQRHEDPFVAIMSAAGKVPEGKILSLRNTFEPLPLYDVLGKRGFVPWARKLGENDWEVFFFNAGRERAVEAGSNSTPSIVQPCDEMVGGDIDGEKTATLTVDVRNLVPPQPMMRILDALERLSPGETLLVHHVRRPAYLYPRLAELGYTAETVELGPDRVDIVIRKG